MRAVPFILGLSGLLLFLGCSGDDLAGPEGGDPRPGVSVSDLALGGLGATQAAGFSLDSTEEAGVREAAVVADHAGAHVLKDPDNTNDLPTLITVATTGQRLFTFDALDAADLLGTVGTQPQSAVTVRGYLLGEPVTVNAVDYYGPPATDLRTYAAQTLAGYPLDLLELEIRSTGGAAGDDLAVGFLELTTLDQALLVFDELPAGTFNNLFAGEFRLTWPGVDDQPTLVQDPSGRMVLTDPARDTLTEAVVVVARADGGVFRCDGLYAEDLDDVDPGDTHNDSLLRLEGFLDGTSAGADEFTPTGAEPMRFDTSQLEGQDLTSLRVTVRSFCGAFKCDDLAVVGLLLTLAD